MSKLKISNLVRIKSKKLGNNKSYTDLIFQYSQSLEDKELPTIFSLKHLSVILGIEYSYLRKIVSREIDPYKTIRIRKRSGSLRKISSPHETLTKLQKWVLKEILQDQKLHSSATAFRKNTSIKDNASPHCEAQWILKIDLKDFFHSIDERTIYKYFKKLGYTSLLSFELSRLLTRSTKDIGKKNESTVKYKFYNNTKENLGYLPQGASTSPCLANLALRNADIKIHEICRNLDLTYTRYADDIVISSQNKKFGRLNCLKILDKVREIIVKCGFTINNDKTQIIPPGHRKIVTGLVVNSSKPTIPKEMKNKIAAHLHFAKKNGFLNHCKHHKFDTVQGFINYIQGLIRFCHSIDPIWADKQYLLLSNIGPAVSSDLYNLTPYWKIHQKRQSEINHARTIYKNLIKKNISENKRLT